MAENAQEKNKGGRPTKYKHEYAEQVYKLKLDGKSDMYIADFFKISRSTLSLWKVEYKDFSDNYKKGIEEYDEECVHRVRNALMERALGYTHADVHISSYQGVITATPIKKYYPPDPTACLGFLHNKAPDEWKPRKAIDVDSPPSQAITLNIVNPHAAD